jgi:hypothetical protein
MSTSQGSENNYPDSNQQNFNSPLIAQYDKPTNYNTQGYGTNNLMPTYDNQINQNIPQSQNIVIQPIPQYQPNTDIYNPFPNVTSINQIPHYGVSQIAENKFQIINGGCFFRLVFPMIFMIIGFGLFVGGLFGVFPIILVGAIFFFVGLGIMYCINQIFFFTLGENSLMVETKTIFGTSSTVYHPGEISKVEFNFHITYDSESGRMNNYNLILFTKNGPISLINFATNLNIFTDQEMRYLTYIVNEHINKNMKV